MVAQRPDGRIERGRRSREAVLAHAVAVASVEGLDGLALGRIAGDLDLSKSGVFALFGSKEELQLATVDEARRVYLRLVVAPSRAMPPGRDRLWALIGDWLTYSRTRVFPGGCFFYVTTAEFEARPGRVRDVLAAARREWVGFVRTEIEGAVDAGDLVGDVDSGQLAFEMIALLEAANGESVLWDDDAAYDRAATAIRSRLDAAAAG